MAPGPAAARPRHRALAILVGLSAAHAVAAALAPGGPVWLLAGLALVAQLVAPGYALLAVIHPLGRGALSPVERASFSVVLSLLLVVAVGLVLAATRVFFQPVLAGVFFALTVGAAAGALARSRAPLPTGAQAMVAPSTPVSLALVGGALVLAAVLWVVPGEAPAAPAAVALLGPDHSAGSLPTDLEAGQGFPFIVQAHAGGEAREGRLVVAVEPKSGDPWILLQQDLALASGDVAEVEAALPALDAGAYVLVVRWDAGEPREARLRFQVHEAQER